MFDNLRKTNKTVLYKTGDVLPQTPPISNQGSLPHIRAIRAGIDKMDPVHKSIFEVSFTLPPLLQQLFGQEDVFLLTQQVTNVSGLDALQKTAAAGNQTFMGASVSYLNPILDNTYADLTMNFNLNLRNVTDNFVLRIFKAWGNLGYDLSDGSRAIKSDYCAASFAIAEANRNGDVWRSYEFKDVMLTGMSNLDDLDYTSSDARQLTCTFRSDYWYDTLATGSE